MHDIHALLLSIYATGCTQYTQVRIALYKKTQLEFPIPAVPRCNARKTQGSYTQSWDGRTAPCNTDGAPGGGNALIPGEGPSIIPCGGLTGGGAIWFKRALIRRSPACRCAYEARASAACACTSHSWILARCPILFQSLQQYHSSGSINRLVWTDVEWFRRYQAHVRGGGIRGWKIEIYASRHR